MDNITKQLSHSQHVTPHEADALLKAFSIALRQCAIDGIGVALPAIGTFERVKVPEHIVPNPANPNTYLLIPPALTLRFTPGTSMKKRLQNG